MAGVSAGTVDRVLHNRGDVSRASRDKVQKVLDEIDYHPNMFAIGLAAKKRYHIVCIIPYYIEHDYWHSVAAGIDRAAQELRPFNVGVDYLFYSHADKASYETACAQLQSVVADGVLIAPNFQDDTLKLTSYLEDKKDTLCLHRLQYGADSCTMLYRPGLQSQRIHRRQNTDAPLPGRAGAGAFPEQSEEQPR